MLNRQKFIAFIELIFIIFTTNSNNLRKGNDLLSPYDQFFKLYQFRNYKILTDEISIYNPNTFIIHRLRCTKEPHVAKL